MVAGRSPLYPRLFVVVLAFGLCCVACNAKNDRRHCEPSSCGNIGNISYPFRLNDDPINCGKPSYELSCENNQTVLYLFSGKYYVQAINYGNGTIRVVDANLQKGNCSSIPGHSLANYSFSDDGYPYSTDQRRHHDNKTSEYIELSKPIIFMTCETRVNSPLYVDTAPCLDSMSSTSPNSAMSRSSGHSFVKIGSLMASDLTDLCRIKLMSMTSSPSSKDTNISYIDIHNDMIYGFEISWLEGYNKDPARGIFCYTGDDNALICRSFPDYGITRRLINFVEFIGYYVYYFAGISIPRRLIIYFDVLLAVSIVHAPTTILGVPCVIVLLVYKWKRRHLSMYGVIEEFLQSHNNLMPIRYTYSDIKKITKGLKDKLGEGGYGTVYKGKLRSGRLVAIKMLGKSKANGQDFMNEVATIGRVHHVNVVRLIGYSAEGSKRALVYEFMSNGSLDKHIFPKEGPISLSCKKTFEISLGVARGIDYLHNGCDMQILHFDIKPHNILLDENFVPKVSDFGLARLCPLDDTSLILTAARGTIGYIAPELFYKNIGGVSHKADIYSFGMLLMEIAGKRRNVNAGAVHSSQIYFPSWVYDQFSDGKDIEIEDATEEEKKITKKMLIVALWCIQMKPSDRPNSMSKVVEMLEGEIECLQMPPKPFLYPQEKPVVDDEDNSETTWSSAPSEDEVATE